MCALACHSTIYAIRATGCRSRALKLEDEVTVAALLAHGESVAKKG
jgi:hypothetical protein